jgi:four helix bundle protein
MKFRYESLEITNDIHRLIRETYLITTNFPSEERFGLTSQIRRAVVSILLNIAEGHARSSTKEYARFVSISIGSLVEVDAAMKVAKSLEFVKNGSTPLFDELVQKVYFTLVAIRKRLEQNSRTS